MLKNHFIANLPKNEQQLPPASLGLPHPTGPTDTQSTMPIMYQSTTISLCPFFGQLKHLDPDKISTIKWVLSSSLMDQQLIHNPNVTPSGYPMKFWGLFGEVSHIAYITQQTFVIGHFAIMNS